MIRKLAAGGLLVLPLLAGCAARHVDPEPMRRPGDESLTCAQLDQQIAADTEQATALEQADHQLENRNIAAGVAMGLIGIPAAFMMDLSREEQIRYRSMLDRIETLRYLKDQKTCPAPA
jgi:hypothetical protein